MVKKQEYDGTVHQLFTDFEWACDSVGTELCNILIVFGIPTELIRLIKVCLNKV
jgi:hypothetical protein